MELFLLSMPAWVGRKAAADVKADPVAVAIAIAGVVVAVDALAAVQEATAADIPVAAVVDAEDGRFGISFLQCEGPQRCGPLLLQS